MNQKIRLPEFLRDVALMLKWAFISVGIGIIVGGIVSIFALCLGFATQIRTRFPWLILGLPLGGMAIVFLYKFFRDFDDRGTNTVVASIQQSEDIPVQMAPLIFISTLLTHLFGGSAGRVGAALQLGGSLSNDIAKLFHVHPDNRRTLILTGMSAGFSALYGTPLAAAVFAIEVISVGVMHYGALVPCALSALTACFVAKFFGLAPEAFALGQVPGLTPLGGLEILALAVLIGGAAKAFCILLHKAEYLYEKHLPNPYLRIALAGTLIILATAAVGSAEYQGTGMEMVAGIFAGSSFPWYAFLLKMGFTALTLGAGFKGGEIAPTLTVGATLGAWLGGLLGLPVPLAAACGMVGLFCGVTNCPITSLLIAFELFGFTAMPYFLATVAVSYMISGYQSLYKKQKIVVSKTRTDYAVHWDADETHHEELQG